MGYITRFTPHAQRDMLKVPRAEAVRILHRLTDLQKAMNVGDTSAFDIKALQGHASRWRLRVGDYRIVYTIEDQQLIVWVLTVGNRREVYRGL
ncbi:type II toxin-antitoxin system RelE family toxin [Actinoallomurus soli]|uniref:type II toxin-antitoxin system RelE family toxin n=1 Tax=Actinoallomurus soli TaxID=2952535 RepID=UPI0020932FF0|nr:type II toxin-antitoxin system RelE/ParE family toxin [Actinoallomurus soli]MCO5966857.1 type II toxin-antitoxin system RelE/ParE family toxin [Actinoallomurus soli]